MNNILHFSGSDEDDESDAIKELHSNDDSYILHLVNGEIITVPKEVLIAYCKEDGCQEVDIAQWLFFRSFSYNKFKMWLREEKLKRII